MTTLTQAQLDEMAVQLEYYGSLNGIPSAQILALLDMARGWLAMKGSTVNNLLEAFNNATPATQLNEARRDLAAERELRIAQLLMVGSELCGDPKIDHSDTSNPRWTPTLREAGAVRLQLSAERERRESAECLAFWDGWRCLDSVHCQSKTCLCAARAAHRARWHQEGT